MTGLEAIITLYLLIGLVLACITFALTFYIILNVDRDAMKGVSWFRVIISFIATVLLWPIALGYVLGGID